MAGSISRRSVPFPFGERHGARREEMDHAAIRAQALALVVPTLLLVSAIVFSLSRLIPATWWC